MGRLIAAVALAAVGVLAAAPAHAETVGGAQLSTAKRTVNPTESTDPLPDIWAATWVLADAETGAVLAHKGAHVQRAPASTLKTLTALTVLPQTDPGQTYVATSKAANIYGSKVGLKPGKTYTMDELWKAVFLPSANDAAIAVAQANGGVRKTVKQMNEVARELGAYDTVAKNTNGLDAPGQLSSAYDLALIARAGLEREDFAGYARMVKAQFPNVKGKKSHTIYTTNRMLLNDWKGAIGVKTGFTSNAGRTFVGAASRKGRTLIVSLMGIKESTEGAATKLLSWGFKNADRVEPVGVLIEAPDAASIAVRSDDAAEDLTKEAESPTAASDDMALETTSTSGSAASVLPAGVVGVILVVALGAGVLLVRRGTSRPGRHTS